VVGVGQPCECDASFPFGQKRSPLQVRYSNHGGLTPAAFVHVRLCIAKIVFMPADVRIAIQERLA
jgi:hypothetical protein